MTILAVNGSPRKKWNTAQVLKSVLDGAAKAGAETKLVHLYDYDFKGCVSCFECKRLGGKNYGRCAVKDGLTPLLAEAAEADALVIGTPVYFGAETGETRSFIERMLFPYLTYTPGYAAIFPRKIPTAMVYTMNVPEDVMEQRNYGHMTGLAQGFMSRTFGSCEVLTVNDTYQFDDYAKYLCTVWDAEAKAQRRKDVFPQDLVKASALGERLAAGCEGEAKS